MFKALDVYGKVRYAEDALKGGVYYDTVCTNTRVYVWTSPKGKKFFAFGRGETNKDSWNPVLRDCSHLAELFPLKEREVVVHDDTGTISHKVPVYNEKTNTAILDFNKSSSLELALEITDFCLNNGINILWLVQAQRDWDNGNLLCIDPYTNMYWWKNPNPLVDALNRRRYFSDRAGAVCSIGLRFKYTEDDDWDGNFAYHIINYNNDIRKVNKKYSDVDSMYTLIGLRYNLPYDGSMSISHPDKNTYFIREFNHFKNFYDSIYRNDLVERKISGKNGGLIYCRHYNLPEVGENDYFYYKERGEHICDGAKRNCLYAGGTFLRPSSTIQNGVDTYAFCLRKYFRFVVEPRLAYLYKLTEGGKAEDKNE